MQQTAVWFSGRVQGVGFRFTTQRIADRYAVQGFVENLRDGRVLMVVQGEAAEIDALIAAIRQEMSHYIERVEIQHQPVTTTYAGFSIRR